MEYQKAAEHAAAGIPAKSARSPRSMVSNARQFTVTEAAAEAIVEAANGKQCDLIVMSSHGRRGLARVLLDSQAMRVLTSSSVAVLICR